MMRWNTAGITVPDVAREMGVEITKQMMWSVGLTVMARYRKLYGALPVKDLRPKTHAKGVHCFAIYPETMRAEIKAAILTYGAEEARQLDMGHWWVTEGELPATI